jgi:hypothetical protein
VLAPTVDAMEAYGFSREPPGGCSEASKKGDSVGCAEGGDEASVSSAGDSRSAKGEETVGACLLVPVAVEASLVWRTGKRPLIPPTWTCFAFPAERTDVLGESPLPWPGIITCSPFGLPSSGDCTELLLLAERELEDVLDLTDTMRGASRVAAVAGMGVEAALSMNVSEATESRMSEGEMEAIV